MTAVIRFLAWERWKSLFRRYFWFFLPWVLCWLLPMTRHFPRQHFLGSPLSREYNQSWTGYFDSEKRYSAAAIAEANPGNFDVKIALIWREQCDVVEQWYSGEETAALAANSDEVRAQAWAAELVRRYPRETWLGSFRLLMAMYGTSPINTPQLKDDVAWQMMDWRYAAYAKSQYKPRYMPLHLKERGLANELIQLAGKQAKLEPNNAFPLLVGAQLLFSQRRFQDGAAWLHRAALRTEYNDHSIETAAAVLRSYETIRGLSISEQNDILEAGFARRYRFNFQSHTNLAALAGVYQAELVRRHDGTAALTIAEDLVAVARAVQKGTSILSRRGSVQTMTHLALYGWIPSRVRGWKPVAIEPGFVRYCKTHGLKARGDRLLAARQQVLHAYPAAQEYYTPIFVSSGAKKVETLMTCGTVFLAHGAFVIGIWLAVAALLFRGIGQPSSRRDRVFVVLPCMLLAGGLCAATWWWEENERNAIMRTGAWNQEGVVVSLAGIAVLLPVFMPVLLCAVGTWSRYRASFALPERATTELKLSRFQAGLLLRTLPVMAFLICVGLIVSWGYWATASWNSWTSFDLLGWMPSPPHSQIPSLTFNPAEPWPLAYFMALTLLISLLWLAKWLWATAPHGKPATHFGVRWYKECLGAYIIGLAWLYFVTALIAWPISNRARAEWDARVQAAKVGRPL